MKKIIAVVFLFAVCSNIEAFSREEIEEAICSIPDKYLVRFVGCTYDKSPAPIQKFANAIHECIDEFYETDGRAGSFVIFMCGGVEKNEDLGDCVIKKAEEIKEPTRAEFEEFNAAVKNCITEAK